MIYALIAAVLYVYEFVGGVWRSRKNIMRGSIHRAVLRRESHSWRWWVWTLACRPSFFLDGRSGEARCYIWFLGHPLIGPLPRRLPPDHMRRLS